MKFWTRSKFKRTNALERKINPTRVPIEARESVRWLGNLRQSTSLVEEASRCIHNAALSARLQSIAESARFGYGGRDERYLVVSLWNWNVLNDERPRFEHCAALLECFIARSADLHHFASADQDVLAFPLREGRKIGIGGCRFIFKHHRFGHLPYTYRRHRRENEWKSA